MHKGDDFTIYGYYSLLNFLSICSPAVYGTSNKEFLHLMCKAARTQSEGPAPYELMKWLDVKVEDNLGIHSENESETYEKNGNKTTYESWQNFKDTHLNENGEECNFYVVILTAASATTIIMTMMMITMTTMTTTTTTLTTHIPSTSL